MSGILLPEIVIYQVLESIIKMLRTDISFAASDEATILYRILGKDEDEKPIKINRYVFFEQAKKIVSNANNLSVNFGYNQKVANNLALHIVLPSETGKIGIGADEGYQIDIEENSVRNYFTQSFDSTYQIMITGNNSSEVNLVYNILKSMLLMCVEHLELSGLRNPSISGNDIIMQDDLTPIPIFHKVLNISFMYEHNVPQLLKQEILKAIFVNKEQ